MRVLLDTSVVSLLHFRRRENPLFALYQPDMAGRILTISLQTVAELWSWARENGWGASAQRRLEGFVFGFEVIHPNMEIAEIWADVRAHTKRLGRWLEAGDAWIAATAAYHEIPLLTHDADFIGLDFPKLQVVSHLEPKK